MHQVLGGHAQTRGPALVTTSFGGRGGAGPGCCPPRIPWRAPPSRSRRRSAFRRGRTSTSSRRASGGCASRSRRPRPPARGARARPPAGHTYAGLPLSRGRRPSPCACPRRCSCWLCSLIRNAFPQASHANRLVAAGSVLGERAMTSAATLGSGPVSVSSSWFVVVATIRGTGRVPRSPMPRILSGGGETTGSEVSAGVEDAAAGLLASGRDRHPAAADLGLWSGYTASAHFYIFQISRKCLDSRVACRLGQVVNSPGDQSVACLLNRLPHMLHVRSYACVARGVVR